MTAIPASIHAWCGQLDDPARNHRCPCHAVTDTQRAAARRRLHEALTRAKRTDWCARQARKNRAA